MIKMDIIANHKKRILFLLLCIGILLLFQLHNYNNTADEEQQQQSMMAIKGANSAKQIQNQRDFVITFKNMRLKYWIEFASPCPAQTKLLILTLTRRDGFARRQGVRQTWMNDSIPGEVIRFLVAEKSQNEANDTQQKLEEEQTKYGDLLFMRGFEDKYKHLHLKVYAGYQWQQTFCANAEWVLKADDDAAIHLRRLAHWSDIKFRPIVAEFRLVYFGLVLYDAPPERNPSSKSYISKDDYPMDLFPSFASGSVYLTTPATICAILSRAPEIGAIFMEDVLYTGILAALANVTRSDHKNHFIRNFNFDEKNAECVGGTPTAFSLYGFPGRLQEYEYHYGRLKSAICRKN